MSHETLFSGASILIVGMLVHVSHIAHVTHMAVHAGHHMKQHAKTTLLSLVEGVVKRLGRVGDLFQFPGSFRHGFCALSKIFD